MPRKPASFYDSRGILWIDCSECNRGGNGTDEDKCSSGWKTRKRDHGGCFCGTLMTGIEVKKP